MKSVNKMKDKKHKASKKPKVKVNKEKVLKVAQEIKFARLLSGNEKKTRDRVLKSFKKWLLSCFERGYQFKEDDFIRVWKGLFYAVWMSDKPLVQEDLCESIAGILDLFPPKQLADALLMFKAGMRVLATEWFGIDQHRMDKFLMLVRRYLRGSLRILQRCGWKNDACKAYADTLGGADGILAVKTPIYARNACSMLLHVMDCFLEELAKVSAGSIPPASVCSLFHPICALIVSGDTTLAQAARRLLTALLRQARSGLQYQSKTIAWKQMGCPVGGPDALVSDDEDEESHDHEDQEDEDSDVNDERPLDPRAGRVDVLLHPVPVPAKDLAQVLKTMLATASSKAHRRTKICLQRFEQLAQGDYPLKVEDVRATEEETEVIRTNPTSSAHALRDLEKSLVAATDELALRGLSRKHRKRLLAKSRAGLSIVADVPQENITSTNGDWEVKTTETKPEKENKQTNKSSNKENKHKEAHAMKRKNAEALKNSTINKKKNNKIDKNRKLDKTKKVLENGLENTKVIDKKVLQNEVKSNKVVTKKDVVNVVKNTKLNAENVINNALKNNKVDNEIVKNDKEKSSKVTQVNKKEVKVAKITTTPQKSIEKQKKANDSMKIKSPVKIEKKVLRGKVEKKNEKVQITKNMYTPKKVKFVLKNNSMQGTIDYYKSVRQSPSIPFDSSKQPSKTNLKVSTPSPINPFFKKKLKLK